MKIITALVALIMFSIISFHLNAQMSMKCASIHTDSLKRLYIDAHQLEPGKVKCEDVGKINIYDDAGRMIKTFDANESGQSELNRPDLTTGIYPIYHRWKNDFI